MENWKEETLGNLCEINIGGTPSRNNESYWDNSKQQENHWVSIRDLNRKVITSTAERITELGVRNSNVKIVKKGTILMSFKLSIGRVAYAGVDLYTNEAIAALETNKIDVDFLYQGLKHWDLLQDVDTAIKGSTLNKAKLRNIKFTIPASKSEQTRIAQILSKADEAISQTEALIAKYQRIKTGLMQDLLTRGIDENGNIRSKATHKFVVKNGMEVPVEWEVKRLVECVDKSTIITYGIVQTGLNVPEGIRVLRTVNLFKDRIDSTNLLRTTKEISDSYKRTILKKYDLVCNVRASVGDFNIIDNDELVNCNTTRGVARISPNKEINPYYLLWFLRSERNTKQMELLIKGTTFIDINIADLRQILIPIPTDKIEQDRIAEKLNDITKTLESFKTTLTKLQSLKKGLMQDLLSGKVRVKI